MSEQKSAEPHRWLNTETLKTRVGEDSGAPVSEDYGSRGNAFNGRIKALQIAIADAAENSAHLITAEDAVRIALSRQ